MWCRLQPASASSSNCRDDTCLIDRGIIYMVLLFRWKKCSGIDIIRWEKCIDYDFFPRKSVSMSDYSLGKV